MLSIDISQNFGEQTEFLHLFIITVFIVWLSLVIYSYTKYGSKKTVMYFLPMILAALFIESAGVASGRYYYPGYIVYLSAIGGGVPLIIILAWSANLFLLFNMAKHAVSKVYQKRNFLQIFLISLITGCFAVCLDLLEDPLAHYNNWWIWKETLGGVTFYGVPLLNFMGWFVLIFYMTLATLLIERSRFSENRKVL
ncbi:MAG: carotenoid biosynthesis protein, partial [Thermoplasmatales archaeon]|nr:carotenoid biosynthesis protein [Thermoplasmatales archaeon]